MAQAGAVAGKALILRHNDRRRVGAIYGVRRQGHNKSPPPAGTKGKKVCTDCAATEKFRPGAVGLLAGQFILPGQSDNARNVLIGMGSRQNILVVR